MRGVWKEDLTLSGFFCDHSLSAELELKTKNKLDKFKISFTWFLLTLVLAF